MGKQDFLKNIKEINDFELINENNEIFSEDKLLNNKNYNLILYMEKIININEMIKSMIKTKTLNIFN